MNPLMLMYGASTFLSASGALQQGEASAQASEYNAQTLRANADLTLEQAKEDERRFRIETKKVIGSMRANYGASGIDMTGSALAVMEESAAAAELDALTIRKQGNMKAQALRNEASMEDRRAGAAREAGQWGAASALLGGGIKLFGG